jgi:midasin (ATPase involved in ribosome maturation)
MEKREILGKAIFDYRNFFSSKKVNIYRDSIAKFIEENESLPTDEFIKKFQESFSTVDLLNKTLSREYLSRISKDLRVIKYIVVIFTILSIISALILLAGTV